MAALSRRDVERMLVTKLGMTKDERDHRVYTLKIDEMTIARTKISTGTGHRTLGDNLVSAIARQLRVSSQDLIGLVQCTISKEDYLRARDIEPDVGHASARCGQ